MGADAGAFDIVPATGQILTKEKLNYEAKNTHMVTVKATDPDGLYDTIDITISVTDVDEAPVSGLLTLTGDTSHSYAEHSKADLGTYVVSGGSGDPVVWTTEGTDGSRFTVMPSGSMNRSGTLQFMSAPNYEMPRGQALGATNTNTYMVTVKATVGGEMKMVEVTVMVTNEEEPRNGKLCRQQAPRSARLSRPTLEDDDIVVGTPDWQWSRVNPSTRRFHSHHRGAQRPRTPRSPPTWATA